MAKMHGKDLFIGIISVRGFFVFDIAPTREIEEPFRDCKRSLIIHCWPGKAIVVGKWGPEAPEDHEVYKLMEAIEGREITEVETKQAEEIKRPETD